MVFTVFVTHGNSNSEFKCSTKRDFLTKILKNYGIIKDELVLIDKESQKEIVLDDIQDKIAVEVKTRHIVANGQGPDTEPEAMSSKTPNLDELIKKLRDNRVLTGLERYYIVDEILKRQNSPNRKRNREGEVQTANKKLQVERSDLKVGKNSYTQTEKIALPAAVPQPGPSTSAKLMQECKLLAKKEKRDPRKVAELMEKQFDDRRNFILMTNPVVSLVREKYPLLFSLSEVRREINQIIQLGTDASFLNNISRYAEVILNLVQEDDFFLSTINDKVKSCSTEKEKQYAREVGALLILSNVAKEKRGFLHTEDEPGEHNNYPRIEAPCKVKHLFQDKYTFKIVVENLLLCEATNFLEAVLCLMASFFIFNISYPDRNFNTFVIMEKVFLEANDTDWNDIDDSVNQIIRLMKLKSKSKNV